ncbi:DUF309 domain-containing protein [Ectobacillus ponti]|uniref:DUF309 domain-containing protein n=1 Tax=Ectobacillus ponti TaxID=2961894 RepID=A0AA41X0X9_9BACI|nr:DUF309 domain-containing protein [Ectobacillus ponti]MCP8966929.1 DUF309 domain-containing protein [Ectobacillus ponti]
MYPEAYIDYLVHFHGDRDYFECHELLEEHWKQDPPASRCRHWVGLIQIAVALYHQRRGNFTGAVRMMNSAISILEQERTALPSLGLDSDALLPMLHACAADMQQDQAYTSLQLPIADPALEAQCMRRCLEKGFAWRSSSDLHNADLLHRHSRRDRSSVIAERARSLQAKKQR